MSLQTEAQKFLATALTDVQTAEHDVQAVLANPAVASFVPMVETEISAVLTNHGVPVVEIETAVTAVLAALNKIATQAASAATGAAVAQ